MNAFHWRNSVTYKIYILYFFISIILFFIFGCQPFSALFMEPQWSDNYARKKGVKINFFAKSQGSKMRIRKTPLPQVQEPGFRIFDGDLKTAVTLMFPEEHVTIHRNELGRTQGGRILPFEPTKPMQSQVGFILTLPKEKSIKKLVIYADNLENFDILTQTRKNIDWQTQARIRKNKNSKIVVNISADAKKIKLKAPSAYRLRESERDILQTLTKVYTCKSLKIYEVELYGFVK